MFLMVLLIFILGTCVGSFLNVLIFRTHKAEKLTGRSKCLSCETPINLRDLFPIASFFILKRRCRFCRASISLQYPLIEFTTGILFCLIYLRYAYELFLPLMMDPKLFWFFVIRDFIFTCLLVVIFVYDLKYSFILDRFTIPGIIISIILNILLGFSAWSIILGGAVLGSFFLIQYIFSKGTWVGGGDIRMGFMIGFMLGIREGIVALLLAYILGAIVAVVLLLLKKVTPKSQIPFGTFLAVSSFIILVFGDLILNFYFDLF